MSKIKLGKHTVEISNPDKVLFPKDQITKENLAEYYKKISKFMLPHIKDRAVTLHRFPNGIDKNNFYQKDSSDFFPGWIKTKKIKKKEGGSFDAPVCNQGASIVYLANLASIPIHIWLSKIDTLEKPDRIIFDLDPPKDDFEEVKFAARKIKNYFEEKLNITPFLMTTGSKGLHVVVPIKAEKNFDFVREVSQKIAELIADEYPDKLTTEPRKAKRKGRVYLDVARNAYGQTGIAPYSVRANDGAPIATPIEWDELSKIESAQKYTIKNIFRRITAKGDPWKGIGRQSYSIKKIKKDLH